jgi:hypothetical protein
MNSKDRIESERASLGALRTWMAESMSKQVPAEHEAALGDLLKYLDAMSAKGSTARGLTVHFLRAIGVIPKSEKSKKYGLGPRSTDLRTRLAEVSSHSLRQICLLRKREKAAAEMTTTKPNAPGLEPVLPLAPACSEKNGQEPLEMSLEEFAKAPVGDDELTDEAIEALVADALGPEGPSDPSCVSTPSSEPLFGTQLEGFIAPREETRLLSEEQVKALKASPTDTVTRISKTTRRVGFELVVEDVSVTTESAFSRESGASARADTSDIGPARSRITWNGLVSLMTLMVGYLVPANRIALLLGGVGAYFTAARCVKHLKYVAARLLPVHLAHARALGNGRLLQVDDTPALCPEVKRAMEANAADPNQSLPWATWDSKLGAGVVSPPDDASLARRLAYELGFANDNKTGGKRKGFKTTVVIGKAHEDDLKSFIVLYHSHLGQAGDLLSHLLAKRERTGAKEHTPDKEKTQVFLVSDLLKTNPPTKDTLPPDVELVWGGCMHHARRNYVLAADDDYVNCTHVRMLFDSIAMYERDLTEKGRRPSNVLAVREKITGPLWEVILRQSHALAERWPKGSPVGRAARFVITHFDKLTVHTKYAHMPDNNTLSERMLRAEKLMHRSSLFRWSIEGRAAWNVVRGIYQTCSMAEVDFRAYLRHVLVADPESVAARPEEFTPLAFARASRA